MSTVESIIDDIIKREGRVYENVAHDKGGPTKFGITLDRLRTERGRHITWENVRDLTEKEARAIYLDAYYHRPGIDKLPVEMQSPVMDWYVTSGTWAIKGLQNLLRDIGFDVPVDGSLGADDYEATENALEAMGADLVSAYAVERTHFFGRIVANNASQGKFLRGWINKRSRPYFKGGA